MDAILKNSDRIYKRMDALLKSRKELIISSGKSGEKAYDVIYSQMSGGKMIRGNLAIISAHAYGYTGEAVYDIAAALEFLQIGILIHDDIMDQDDMRRGKPTVHAVYGQQFNAHAASSLAICVGDILFFLASDIVSSADSPPETKNKLVSYISQKIMQTGIAQMDDVYFSQNEKVAVDDVMRLYRYKTAEYTFVLPLIAGALCAGYEKDSPVLESLGREIGIIFQIRDDMLDLFGDEKKIGKPVGSDIAENKKTVMAVLLHERASSADLDNMKNIFGAGTITPDMVQTIRSLLSKYQIDTYLDADIAARKQDIQDSINRLSIAPEHKKILSELVDYVSRREV